jgi:hypothetical protein
MNENNILYGCSILLFILILITLRVNKSVGFIHLILFILYSSILYYGFFYKSEGGTALAWWFYLALTTGIHLLIIVGYLVFRYFKK